MPLCPTYHYIDRADGGYARSAQFEKDYAAILSSAWDIDTAISRYVETPDADTSELLHLLGIDENRDSEYERRFRRLINSDLIKGSWKDRYVDPFPWSTTDPR